SREAMGLIAGRLATSWSNAGPGSALLRGAIAAAEHDLALYVGDARAAAIWSARKGCATEATVIGPTDASPLVGLDGSPPVAFDRPLAQEYAGVAPFAAKLTPTAVHADACRIDVNATTFLQGLRVVVIDFEVPKAQRAYFSLSSTSAAAVDIGGVQVI